MFADYHVHTQFSDDSLYPMEQVVQDAIAMKMEAICFTDHVDYGVKDDWDCGRPIIWCGGEPAANVDYPAYAAKIKELQAVYGAEIEIKMGLEFGMQRHTIPQYEKLLQSHEIHRACRKLLFDNTFALSPFIFSQLPVSQSPVWKDIFPVFIIRYYDNYAFRSLCGLIRYFHDQIFLPKRAGRSHVLLF